MGKIKKVTGTIADLVKGAKPGAKDQSSYLKVDPDNHPEGTPEHIYAKDLIKSRHAVIVLSMNEKGEVFTAIPTTNMPFQQELQQCTFRMGDSKYDVFGKFPLSFFLNSIPNDNKPSGNFNYELRREKLQAIKDFAAIREKPIKILYYDAELYQLKSKSKKEINVLVTNYIKEKQMDELDIDLKTFTDAAYFNRKCIYVNKKISDIVDDELSEKMLDCSPCRVEILTKLSESMLPDVVFETMHEELLDNNLENTKFK
ncbi:MAG: hypothetical protein ACXVHT_06220 [Methanobacterium sp.]